MANKEFKKRLADAVAELIDDKSLLKPPKNSAGQYQSSLYTPMRLDTGWTWMAFSEPDGILARKVDVLQGSPAKPTSHTEIWLGVLVQSEQSTSDSLLNPWGKACLPTIPTGVWIDIKNGNSRVRNILTIAHVLLVTPVPTSTAKKTQDAYKRRKSILERVDDAAADATLLPIEHGLSASQIATKIWGVAEEFLK